MEKIFAQYIQLRLSLEEMLGAGEIPDEDTLKRIREIESYLRDQGFDPDEIYLAYKNKENSFASNSVKKLSKTQKIISRAINLIKPVFPSDQGFVRKAEAYTETEEGITYEVVEPWLIAACGRKVKEEEIAGRCAVCNQYECKAHFVNCYEPGCRIPLCINHSFPFVTETGQEIWLCLPCRKVRERKFNMWEAARNLISPLRRIALPKPKDEDEF